LIVVARALCSDASQSAHSSSTVTALRGTNWSSGRLLPDLGQRIAGLLLGGETAAHLLTLSGRAAAAVGDPVLNLSERTDRVAVVVFGRPQCRGPQPAKGLS
jgi:hypothetical protein